LSKHILVNEFGLKCSILVRVEELLRKLRINRTNHKMKKFSFFRQALQWRSPGFFDLLPVDGAAGSFRKFLNKNDIFRFLIAGNF
jgi:hypothetical protein